METSNEKLIYYDTPKNINLTVQNPFKNKEQYSIAFRNLRIAVVNASAPLENTEVIVNPANAKLQNQSGIGALMVKLGGEQIQIECNKIIERLGKVNAGQAVMTPSGSLSSISIIHCVGPIAFIDQEIAKQQLQTTVKHALELCDSNNLTSIAIPLMSYGDMIGFSKERAANLMFEAVLNYIANTPTNIRHIRFANIDKNISDYFESLLKKFQAKYNIIRSQIS